MQRTSIILLQYAGFLLVIGLASVFYSAETRTAGWNQRGISGLIACGGAAAVVAVMGFQVARGKSVAAWVGLTIAFLLLSYGGFTAFKLLRDVDGNAWKLVGDRLKEGVVLIPQDAERAILYKAGIFGFMAIFSLSAFIRLGAILRNDRTA